MPFCVGSQLFTLLRFVIRSTLVLNVDAEQKVMCNIHQLILCVVSMVTAL